MTRESCAPLLGKALTNSSPAAQFITPSAFQLEPHFPRGEREMQV